MTFAGGRWYVAWGGRPSNTIFVQRFTAEGHADGAALQIQGTTMPLALIATTPHRGGQLVLLGSVLPAYTDAGWTHSVHRLDLDLNVLGTPLLLRGPSGSGWLASTIEADDAGGVLWTTASDRPGVLLREIRVPPDAAPGQAPATRDWWLQTDRFASRERIEGQDQLLEAVPGSLQLRALLGEGKLGAPQPILELPPSEARYLLLSRRIGTRLYVGTHAATAAARTVRIQALDASSLAPLGGPIELTWPQGHLEGLLDAHGTPMLIGSVRAPGEPVRVSLVPLDLIARAACPVTTVALPERAGPYQVIRAIRFEGSIAGVTIAAWGSSGATRLFFTRLRCMGNAAT
jgi:hypothetical protein